MKSRIKKELSWLVSLYKVIPLIFKSILEKDLFTQSAALSYYCALSLAPFMILAITSFSFFGPSTEAAFINQVQQTVGSNASEAILMVIEASKNSPQSRGISGILGLLTLVISASAVFSQLKNTITAIFTDKKTCDVEPEEESLLDFIKAKIFSIGLMISFIFLSLISLVLSAALPLVLPTDSGDFWMALNFIISFGIYTFVFFLVFYFVSSKKVEKLDAAIGGVISALLFVFGRSLISQ